MSWPSFSFASCILVFSRSLLKPAAALSRGTLESTFDRDMRNVVYRWAPEDPRPEAERRAALFDFIYQTYDSSAWIPQSLFDGNLATHAIVGSVDTIVATRWGSCYGATTRRVPAFGMAPNAAAGSSR